MFFFLHERFTAILAKTNQSSMSSEFFSFHNFIPKLNKMLFLFKGKVLLLFCFELVSTGRLG